MSSKALPWLATALITGGVVGVLSLRGAPRVPRSTPTAAPAGSTIVPGPLAPELAPIEAPEHRTRAVSPQPAADASPRAFGEETSWKLDVLVLDPDDQPLAGAAILLAPIELPLDVVGWTDANGRLEVELAAARDTQRVLVAAEHGRFGLSPLRVLELTPRPWRLAIELRPRPDAPRFGPEEAGAIFDPRRVGMLASAALVAAGTGARLEGMEPPALAETAEIAGESLVTRLAPDVARRDERGRLHFTQLLEQLPGMQLDAPRGWTLPEPAPLVTRDLDPRGGVLLVKGVVRDARGDRVADARVRASDAERQLEFTTRSFEDGSFGLGPLPASGVHLSIGGGDLGRYDTDIGGAGERFQTVQAALQRGRVFAGRLSDDAALPLAGWRLEVRGASGSTAWADVTWSDAQGRFSVANVPSGMLRVDVFTPHGEAFPVVCERGVWAEPDFAIVAPAHAADTAKVELALVTAEGLLVDDAEVRLSNEATDHALCVAYQAARGVYSADGLPPGRYRLAIHCRGERSIHWPEPLDLAAGDARELGEITFAAHGVLAVDAHAALGAVEYTLERPVGAWELFAGSFRASGRFALHLAPGAWVLRARSGGIERRFELDVDARRARVVRLTSASFVPDAAERH